MKNRFEINMLDSERCLKTGLQLDSFEIMDNEAKELVSNAQGQTRFFDFSDFSDVPSYVTKYVTVYRVDRNYGGAEEGGWYYDEYNPKCSVKACHSSIESIKALLTENYAIEENRDSDFRLVVELNKNSMIKPRPFYE